MKIRIDSLICFQFVAKYKSFSKAADALYITQSSVSKKIKALEEMLGGELFIRKSNGTIALSSFGESMSTYINNIIEDYNLLISAADNFRLTHLKKMTIATFLNVAHSQLLKHVTSFECAEENFYIETVEKEHSALVQLMSMRQAEICFGYKELLGETPDYEIYELYKDPLILITSKQYAEQKGWGNRLNLSDTKDVKFCFPREDMALFSFLINACKSHGFVPQLTNSDVRLGTIRQYISAGIRCTMQFESISRSKFYQDHFVFVELDNAPILTMCVYSKIDGPRRIRDSFIKYILARYNK